MRFPPYPPTNPPTRRRIKNMENKLRRELKESNRQILRDCTYHKIRGKISLNSTKERARISFKIQPALKSSLEKHGGVEMRETETAIIERIKTDVKWDEWQEQVNSQITSGLTVKEWCRQNNVSGGVNGCNSCNNK